MKCLKCTNSLTYRKDPQSSKSKVQNLKVGDRIQAEFILVLELHGKERGDWEEIEEEEVEGKLS